MVTIADLGSWRPGDLGPVTDVLLQRKRSLTDLQDEVDAARPPASWFADSSTGARAAHEALRLRLLDVVAEVGKVAASLDFAEVELAAAKRDLETALDQASAHGLTVDRTTGRVTDPATYDDQAAADEAAAIVDQVVADISAALTQAQTADDDLARALQSAVDGLVDGGIGDLAHAAAQLPSALDGMSAEEIALRYADDVALETIRAYLDVEVEFATWEAEAGAEATYVVRGDGSVVMSLHLEGGLGREVDVGGAEVDASAGVTSDLELTFDSAEEAQAFLDGFDDAVFDIPWYGYGTAPTRIAENVADYVGQQDITSFRTGIYGEASAEFDTSWASGEASGRVEGYYDWVKDEFGLRVQANLSADLGGEGSDYSGAAQVTGQAVVDSDGQLQEVTFSGQVSAAVANERLGLDLPGTTSGAGADIEMRMDQENPYFEEFNQAMTSGDLDHAADLALDHGRVVVRVTVIEELASEEHEIGVGGQGVEIEYGATATVADQVWVRPPGQDYVVPLDPQEIP